MTKKQEQLVNAVDLGKDISRILCEISDGAGMSDRESVERVISNLTKKYIPYEPATCPDCGHPVSMHDVVDGCMQKLPFAKDSYSYCSCDKFPADQPEIALTHEERVDLSNQAFDKFIQPMPMMPLREQTVVIPPSLLADFVIKEIELEVCGMYYELAIGNKDDCRCDENGPCMGVSEVMDRLKPKIVQAITTSQQAHDSAIRREFAEKVIEGLPSDFFSWAKDNRWGEVVSGAERQYFMVGVRAVEAHIRALAEKEG